MTPASARLKKAGNNMSFTLVGWSASVDQVALAAIAAIPDPHVRINGSDVIVPSAVPNLVGFYANGVNITRAQLVSPSLRRFLNFESQPVDVNATPLAPFRFTDLRLDPILLDGEEALNALTSESGAGATRMNAFAWLSDGIIEPVDGDIRSVRVTSAQTLTAFQWTNAALTFDQQLPAGEYQVVGARFQSAGLLAYRLVLPGHAWRPGGIGVTTDAGAEGTTFRVGNFGAWGSFRHNTPPTVDFCSVSADTSQIGTLDLVKVA